jgi:DNA-binding CsgD family transcriptional regulator
MHLKDRFYKKFEVADSGCWEWQASKNPAGYGWFAMNDTMFLAHRASWIIHNGDIPAGLCILHSCDNPACVNPAHLRVGTHFENTRDKYERGRELHLKGSQNGRATLTEDQVAKILSLQSSGLSRSEVAERFGISRPMLARIWARKLWKHVPIPENYSIDPHPLQGSKHGAAKLNESQVAEILSLRASGLGQQKIAAKFGVSRSLIGAIWGRKVWKHVQ